MHFFTLLALILLTLVGFSAGSVLGAKRLSLVPGVADLAAILILWTGGILTRSALGAWAAIGVWLLVGLILGATMAWMRKDSPPPEGDLPLHPDNGLWSAWKRFGLKMSHYQSRVLMAYLYFIIVMPFALCVKIWGDPLGARRVGLPSNWQPKNIPSNPTLDDARRQF